MFTKTLAGTGPELEREIKELTFPVDVLAPDAVRSYAIGHIPKHSMARYKLVLTVQSIANQRYTTLAGHVSVVLTE
jgi:DNA polymerase II small subunit/DNA polymerase delta subunit B